MSRTLSPDEQEARYTWLTPAQAARVIGADAAGSKDGGAEFVRSLIRDGHLGRPGEIRNISRSAVPRYLIHPRAAERYNQESVRKAENRRGAA
jgi:hypothetical protein